MGRHTKRLGQLVQGIHRSPPATGFEIYEESSIHRGFFSEFLLRELSRCPKDSKIFSEQKS